MKTFPATPFGAAAIFTVLGMGAIGLVVVLPIACIHWTWNQLLSSNVAVPPINIWQAVLLYLAMSLSLFLSGVVQIEVEPERIE